MSKNVCGPETRIKKGYDFYLVAPIYQWCTKIDKYSFLLFVHHKACWTSMLDLILSHKIGCQTSVVRQQIKLYEKWTNGTTITTLLVNTNRCGSIENKILLRLIRIKLF